jgi:hypothetical protein
MSISEAMLAQALFQYLEQHAEQFQEFLSERYDTADLVVTWHEDPPNKRLLALVRRMAQDESPYAENEYSLRIERLDRRSRVSTERTL